MAGVKSISRTRLEAQQRLDLPDFNSVQELLDEGIQSAFGGLIGRGSGLLSPLKYSLSDDGVTYWLTPGAFSYYWSKRDKASLDGTYRAWKGNICTFDPSAEGQTQQIDYTAAQALATVPTYLYVRPKTVNTATDARRKWVAGAETSVSVKTRMSVVHEFKLAVTAPDHADNDGWASILYISGWGPISAQQLTLWDALDAFKVAEQGAAFSASSPTSSAFLAASLDTGTDLTGSGTEDFNGGATSDRSLGLVQMMMQLRARLYRHLDVAGTTRWTEDPPRDFAVLDTDLTATDAAAAALATRVYAIEGKVVHAAYIKCTGIGVYTITYFPDLGAPAAPPFTIAPVIMGALKVKVTGLGAPAFAITSVHVTPALDTAAYAFQANEAYVEAPTAADHDFIVRLRDSAGAALDSSFFLTVHTERV